MRSVMLRRQEGGNGPVGEVARSPHAGLPNPRDHTGIAAYVTKARYGMTRLLSVGGPAGRDGQPSHDDTLLTGVHEQQDRTVPTDRLMCLDVRRSPQLAHREHLPPEHASNVDHGAQEVAVAPTMLRVVMQRWFQGHEVSSRRTHRQRARC